MSTNVVGVDMGGTKILSAVIDPEGNILSTAKVPTKADKDTSIVIDRIAECIQRAIDKSGVTAASIQAVGIGAPGPLDPRHRGGHFRAQPPLEGCSTEGGIGGARRLSDIRRQRCEYRDAW